MPFIIFSSLEFSCTSKPSNFMTVLIARIVIAKCSSSKYPMPFSSYQIHLIALKFWKIVFVVGTAVHGNGFPKNAQHVSSEWNYGTPSFCHHYISYLNNYPLFLLKHLLARKKSDFSVSLIKFTRDPKALLLNHAYKFQFCKDLVCWSITNVVPSFSCFRHWCFQDLLLIHWLDLFTQTIPWLTFHTAITNLETSKNILDMIYQLEPRYR